MRKEELGEQGSARDRVLSRQVPKMNCVVPVRSSGKLSSLMLASYLSCQVTVRRPEIENMKRSPPVCLKQFSTFCYFLSDLGYFQTFLVGKGWREGSVVM